MRRLLLFLLCACLQVATATAAAAIVPGKAFERFITIWLENQVRFLTFFPLRPSHPPLCYVALLVICTRRPRPFPPSSLTTIQDFAKVAVDASIVDLKREGILLTRYYAQTHPSQPNYLAAVGGDYFGLNHDDWVRLPENVATVADLLEDKDVSWAGYFEDMPSPGYMGNHSDGSTGNGGWDYVRKHRFGFFYAPPPITAQPTNPLPAHSSPSTA